MTVDEFQQALGQNEPPGGIPPLLQALWWERRGDWERGHAIAQDQTGPDAAWVHAYLHRREGDDGNARYWYRQAGRVKSSAPLQQEWLGIVAELLGKEP